MAEENNILTPEQRDQIAAEGISERLDRFAQSLLEIAVSKLNAAKSEAEKPVGEKSDPTLVLEIRKRWSLLIPSGLTIKWKEGEDRFYAGFIEKEGESPCRSFGAEFGKDGKDGTVAVIFDSDSEDNKGKIVEIALSGPPLRNLWFDLVPREAKSCAVSFKSLEEGQVEVVTDRANKIKSETKRVGEIYVSLTNMLSALEKKLPVSSASA